VEWLADSPGGAFEAWAGLKGPKKMIIMETEWITGPKRPWRDHQDVILRWYDHWLKQNDTGMMDEPPISLWIKGRNKYRHESEWPLARTHWRKFYLVSEGGLSDIKPPSARSVAFRNDPHIPPNKPSQGLDFATPVLEQDLEITGPLALYLHASLDQPEATWIVIIRDRAADGSAAVVTKGWLRASHRAVDAARSTPAKPTIRTGKPYRCQSARCRNMRLTFVKRAWCSSKATNSCSRSEARIPRSRSRFGIISAIQLRRSMCCTSAANTRPICSCL